VNYVGGNSASGRFARGRFTPEPGRKLPEVIAAENDPVIAQLRRDADIAELERLIGLYPNETLEFVARRRRGQQPPEGQRQP
jgi:hypothetical protein